MKLATLLFTFSACLAALTARAADKTEIAAHHLAYHSAGKAVLDMVLTKKIDLPAIEKHVDIMVAEALWMSAAYAKVHPAGAKLLKLVADNVATMRKLSFKELEDDWHDLGYFSKPGVDVGLDLKAEDNEHFTDPIHTLVHPLLVLKAAQAYAANHSDDDLKSMKEEMEEGLEQAEKQKAVLEAH